MKFSVKDVFSKRDQIRFDGLISRLIDAIEEKVLFSLLNIIQ